jgi:hypothetical protein
MLRIMLSRNNIMTVQAICRAIRGQNTNNGTTSSARKSNQTPIYKNVCGKNETTAQWTGNRFQPHIWTYIV